MKVLGINGSHRKGKNTAIMLKTALGEAEKAGMETELIEITDLEIKPCISCNKCLFKPECVIKDDDMEMLYQKLQEVDGIIIGSPVYFSNVTGRLKDFIDRSRPLHMTKNLLESKVGGSLVHAGLRNGGQELALQILNNFLLGHGILVVDDRGENAPIISTGATGTMCREFDGKKMSFFKSVEEDAVAMESSRRLGENVVRLLNKIN